MNNDDTKRFWWAAGTKEKLLAGDAVEGVRVEYGARTLRSCALKCGAMQRCTAFTHSELIGCAFWLDGKCSTVEAEGMTEDAEVVATYRMCSDAAESCAGSDDAADDGEDSNAGRLPLALNLPCSSWADDTAASTTFAESEAACRPEYAADVFPEQVREYKGNLAALRAR